VGTGRSNLGRVGKDTSRQRRNQSAPWVLGTPTEADKKVAREYLADQRQPARPAANPTTFSTEPPF